MAEGELLDKTFFYYPDANSIAMATAGSERLRIDTKGYLRLGETAGLDARLTVQGETNDNTKYALKVTDSQERCLLSVRNDGNVAIKTLSIADEFDIARNFRLAGGYGTILRSGVFGSSNHTDGNTHDKWIKFGEFELQGAWNAAGVVIEFYPVNANHGDSRQQISVQMRNDRYGNIEGSYEISLINMIGGSSPQVKDVKVINKSGAGGEKNVMAIWIQMNASWLANVPILVSYYGNFTMLNLTNQPQYEQPTNSGVEYGFNTYFGSNTVGGDWNVLGNVGIGTKDPDYDLEVNGDISVGVLQPGFFTHSNKYGNKLWFNGEKQNSDDLWIARFNVSRDKTNLRVNIGDQNHVEDQFEVGCHYHHDGIWRSWWYVDKDGDHVISDEKLKTSISNITKALNKVQKLRGVEFHWSHREEKNVGACKKLGVIAQEVESIIPNVVSTDETGYKFVNYNAFVPIFIEAIKEQQKQIEMQQKEIKLLRKKMQLIR